MLQYLLRHGRDRRAVFGGGDTHFPPLRQRSPQYCRGQGATTELKRLHNFAERSIGRVQQHDRTTQQLYPSVADRLGGRDTQLSTLLGRWRFVRTGVSFGNDSWG